MINLKKLQLAAIEEFAPLLEKAGFKREVSNEDKFGFTTIFVSGDRYVKLYANCHPRDYPPYFNVVLGEGSLESPDNDWNFVALWRMGAGRDYLIEKISDFTTFFKSVKKDFQSYECGFLTGDLKVFRKIRAAQTQAREPYLIYKPGKDGRYVSRPEPESVRLKKKYSRE